MPLFEDSEVLNFSQNTLKIPLSPGSPPLDTTAPPPTLLVTVGGQSVQIRDLGC